VGDDIDSWSEEPGGEDRFVEVLECVGAFHLEGAHGAGQDDGDGEGVVGLGVLDEGLVEPFAGFTQGVCAVEDDDAAAAVGVCDGVIGGGTYDEADSIEDSLAVCVGQIQRILLHELECIDLGVFVAEEAEHLLDDRGAVHEGSCVLIVGFLDGSAC